MNEEIRKIQNKLLILCDWSCKCGFCGRKILRGEKYLNVWANAWKGSTRTNICKECLIQSFLELNTNKKEVDVIRKVIILNALSPKEN